MTDLYPIGVMATNNSEGTIDDNSYSIFEPNGNVNSVPTYYNYTTKFQGQTLLTRKKALPTLTIKYGYSNIFQDEFQQIAHFIDSKEDNLESFYVIDFSQVILPTSITANFDITMTNTRLFSKIANQKAHYVFFWNGVNWKFGTVVNTSSTVITTDITSANCTTKYGDMTSAQVVKNYVYVYPVYECYTGGESLSSFTTSGYAPTKSSDTGYIYSGELNFITKYKI